MRSASCGVMVRSLPAVLAGFGCQRLQPAGAISFGPLQQSVDRDGAGLLTGEVGAGKSTAARTFVAALNPNLYKILYLHWTSGSALDLLRQIALELGLEPEHYRGDLAR